MRTATRLVDLRTATPAAVEVWLAEDGAPVPVSVHAELAPAFTLAGAVDGPLLFDSRFPAIAYPPGRPGAELTMHWLGDPARPLHPQVRGFVMVLQVDGIGLQRIRGIAPRVTFRQLRAGLECGMTTVADLDVDSDGGALYWRYAL